MIKRIMVPLDGSQLAEQALPLAETLASAFEAELLLASAVVASEQYAYYASEDNAGMLAESGCLASERYLSVKEDQLTGKGFRVRSSTVTGRAHMVISSLCDREGVDLVVMTTHGRSGVSRWTMGSVADKVLRTTDAPLILIHPTVHGTPPSTINRVVVALDGSELAEAALPLAQRVAKYLDAKIHLVRVVVPASAIFGAEYLPGTLHVLEEMETEAKEYLKAIAAKLRSKGLTVTAVVRTGIPTEAILAESQAGDMVVISTHGRSGVERWFLGSVADAVVRHGDIPVLVVRSWVTLDKPEYPPSQKSSHVEPEYVATTPLIVAGVPPVIPVPDMHEHQEVASASKARPDKRTNRPEARGRQLR